MTPKDQAIQSALRQLGLGRIISDQYGYKQAWIGDQHAADVLSALWDEALASNASSAPSEQCPGLLPSEPAEPVHGNKNAEGLIWAAGRWNLEVRNRPLVNVNRRPLDDTWRQVIRYFGGDPDTLLGPNHDTLLAIRYFGGDPDTLLGPAAKPDSDRNGYHVRYCHHCDNWHGAEIEHDAQPTPKTYSCCGAEFAKQHEPTCHNYTTQFEHDH